LARENIALCVSTIIKHHHFDRLQLAHILGPFKVILKSVSFGSDVEPVVHWASRESETALKSSIARLGALHSTIWSIATLNAIFHCRPMISLWIVETIPIEFQVLCAQEMEVCSAPPLSTNSFETIAISNLVRHVVELSTTTPEEITLTLVKWSVTSDEPMMRVHLSKVDQLISVLRAVGIAGGANDTASDGAWSARQQSA